MERREAALKLMQNDFWQSFGLPAIAGLILAFSFPPSPLGFLAWAALTPLILSLEGCSIGEAYRRGAVFALVFNALSMYFLAFNSGAAPPIAITSWVGLVVYATLISPLFLIPVALSLRKWKNWGVFSFPIFWTGFEYLKSLGEIAWPWNIIPLSQSNYLAPMQMVSITGVWGLSFWVTGINALIYLAVKRSTIWLLAVILWITIPFIAGNIALKHPPQPVSSVNVAIVQGNVVPEDKWANGLIYNIGLYRNLTEEISGAELIVWPESAVPTYLNMSLQARRILRGLAERMNAPIFTGALALFNEPEDIERRYNSAFLIKPDDSEIERFDKIHLVPFGERVPFQKLIPSLGKLNFGQAEFTIGQDYHIFQIEGARFGAMVCYESIFPQIVRRFVADSADFLVNITNDGWYGKTVEPYQHALLTRFRSIESRRSMVRAANTGISYFTDAQGRFLARTKMEIRDILQVELPIYDGFTFYQRFGDIFAYFILIICLFITILHIILGCLVKR